MMGGLAYMTGPPGQPLRAGSSVNDIMGGMFGAIGILAAVAERERTGRGRHVQSGLFENNVLLMAQHMAQFAISGVEAPPMSVRQVAWPIYDLFDTADGGQVFVGVVTDTQWRLFCAEFGLSALADDPALATQALRVGGPRRGAAACERGAGDLHARRIDGQVRAARPAFRPDHPPGRTVRRPAPECVGRAGAGGAAGRRAEQAAGVAGWRSTAPGWRSGAARRRSASTTPRSWRAWPSRPDRPRHREAAPTMTAPNTAASRVTTTIIIRSRCRLRRPRPATRRASRSGRRRPASPAGRRHRSRRRALVVQLRTQFLQRVMLAAGGQRIIEGGIPRQGALHGRGAA